MEQLIVESVDPRKLNDKDFIGIHNVMQDMWASEEGLGELAQCNDCGTMMSKEKVFRHLPEEFIQETVADTMQALGIESFPCISCKSNNTRLIYGLSNVEKIKDRVLRSTDSFLVVCRSETKGIVGFEEAYIASLERMFALDLADHYKHIGLPEIRARVGNILGYVPENMFLFSSIGLLKPYRNFQNLFEILHRFSLLLPDHYLGTPGLTELDRGGVTYRMNAGINQGVSLGIGDDPKLRAKMTNTGENYDSDLIVSADPVKIYHESFTNGPRQFLRMMRGNKTTNTDTHQTHPLAA